VAAGIINPITGRWMTKSWRFDDFAPEAKNFYTTIEQHFSIRLYHPLPAVRFSLNSEDAKRFGRRSRNARYSNVLGSSELSEREQSTFNNPHGGFQIQGAAYVNLPLTIEALRAYFLKNDSYEDCVFNYEELKKHQGNWRYLGESYEQVIFCEGAMLKDNPWFCHLPITPAKGETLLCRSDSLNLEGKLYHHGKWLLPYPDGSFRIGATYDEADLSAERTEAGKDQLTAAFMAMTQAAHDFKILDQPAGLRPSTRDARPFLGAHPTEPGLYIFNGLGSKGASLSPKLSLEFMDYLYAGKPLDPETDIRRFC